MIFVRYLFRVLRYLTTFRVPEHVHDRIDEIIGRVVSEEEEKRRREEEEEGSGRE
jgi:hypothetical protein